MGLSFSVGQYLLIDPFSGSAENATINDMLQIIMSKYAGRYGDVSLRTAVTAICDKLEAESRPTPVEADVAHVRSCNDCGRDYESDGYCDHSPMCRNAA